MPITQVIENPTAPPSLSQPLTFQALATAFVDSLPDFETELNTYAGQANTLETTVSTASAEAEGFALSAQTSEQIVLEQGDAVAYSGSGTYSSPQVVIGTDGYAYRCLGTSVTGDDPVTSVTGNWVALNKQAEFVVSLLLGGGIFPGWNMQAQDSDGTYPPTDPDTYDQIVWSRQGEYYKAAVTWGAPGGATDGCLVSATITHSVNGTTYTAISNNNKLVCTYDAGGALIGYTWSAP